VFKWTTDETKDKSMRKTPMDELIFSEGWLGETS